MSLNQSRLLNSFNFGSFGPRGFYSGGVGGIRSSGAHSLGMGVGEGTQLYSALGSGLAGGAGRLGSAVTLGSGRGSSMAFGSYGGGLRLGLSSGAGGGGGSGAGFWAGGSSSLGGGFTPFAPNEKLELQTLNDRLAAYLDKVRKLELANHELEEKIRGFTANKVQITYDFEAFQSKLQPLREQLADVVKECTHLTTSIDNATLAVNNFRVKFENEAAVRQSVEGDIATLKALKKDYEVTIASLTQDYEILQKERDTLQTTHQQEVLSLRDVVSGTLTVDVQAENTADLSKTLSDLRAEYEHIVQKNRNDIENWFTDKLTLKDKEIVQVTDVTVSGSTEIAESRSQILSLKTDLDALLLRKSYQEQRLGDVKGQKQGQLLNLSRLAASLEGELASLRESALQQAQEYQLLLSTKMQLEKEITGYKSLLEGAGEISIVTSLKPPSLSVKTSKMSERVSTAPEVSAGGGIVEDGVEAVRRRAIHSPYEAFLD
ncbi:keratin, type I cytoskeletal 13-like [Hoplias malabaricus]|uniref:keratin, type I cytoskeletal 13-like n=1 Tax=Hoplias malabaricus TaxID=27720 RepID=UPI003461BD1E